MSSYVYTGICRFKTFIYLFKVSLTELDGCVVFYGFCCICKEQNADRNCQILVSFMGQVPTLKDYDAMLLLICHKTELVKYQFLHKEVMIEIISQNFEIKFLQGGVEGKLKKKKSLCTKQACWERDKAVKRKDSDWSHR